MKNLRIVNYQRNGVSGDPFFTATYEEDGRQMLATFEANEDDRLNSTTCRVVCLDDYSLSWRGDQTAYDIQAALRKPLLKYASIYDVMLAETNKFGPEFPPRLRKDVMEVSNA